MLFQLFGSIFGMALLFAVIIWIHRQFKMAWQDHKKESYARMMRQHEAAKREAERREAARPRCQIVPEYDEAVALELEKKQTGSTKN